VHGLEAVQFVVERLADVADPHRHISELCSCGRDVVKEAEACLVQGGGDQTGALA